MSFANVVGPSMPDRDATEQPWPQPTEDEVFCFPADLAEFPAPIDPVLVGTHMPMATRIFDPSRHVDPPRPPKVSCIEEATTPFAGLFTRTFEERTQWIIAGGRYDTASQTYHADGIQIYCDGGGGGGNTCPYTYYSLTDSGNCNFKDDENDGPHVMDIPD